MLLALLLLAQATGAVQKTRVCDKTNPARCATVDAAGAVSVSGTINATSATHNTAAAPTYVEGTDNPFSGNLTGALRVLCMDGTCGGASPFADNAAFTAGTTSVSVVAGVFNDSITALTSGSAGAPRLTSKRAVHFNLRDNSGVEVPFPAALDADLGFKVHVQNAVAVTGTFWQATQPVSGTFWQATQPVSGTFWQATQPVSGTVAATESGTWTVQQGTTPGTNAGAWWTQIGDTTNGPVAVKAASTAAVAADKALVVAVSPNNTVGVTGTFWQATQPVSGTVTANQGGTWTVQPGNTANTTAWKVDGSAVTQPVSIAAGVTQGAGNTANPWAVQGTVADGVNIAGNPVPIGLKATALGAAPATVTAGQESYAIGSLDRIPFVLPFHPNMIACHVAVSTATTLTAIGGSCATPGASKCIFITSATFSASAASGTAADAMPTIKSGSGGTCGTATAVVFAQFNPANGGWHAPFPTPVRVPANSELCWIDSTAGSKLVDIVGFIAPC